MSRKELEIALTYETTDANGFTPDEQADYEAWLDSLDRGDEGYTEPSAEMQPFTDDEIPF